ncbi:hypothetical protein ACWCPS_35755 [Streptomyces mauvecolor]
MSQAMASVVPGGLVADQYEIPNAPDAGLMKIGFPVTVIDRPDAAGYYWAQEFSFEGGHGGYIGVASKNGGQVKFSAFGEGFTTDSSHCRAGADGGSGVSCNISYSIAKKVAYRLEIAEIGKNAWRGSIVDPRSGTVTEIGRWSAPDGSGLLKSKGTGFVEYYASVSSCESIPYAKIYFGAPYTLKSRGGKGSVTGAYAYGRCKGDAKVDYRLSGDGVYLAAGG